MWTITKRFSFDASHQLGGLPKGHPCTRLHGHTYEVIVELKSPMLKEPGFVRDYNDLKEIKNILDSEFDHRHLNDVLQMNPTAEIIAQVLFERFKPNFPELSAITVKETPKTAARYEPTS